MKHRKTIPLERPAMKTTLLIAIGLAALWGSGAQAAQITFGPSNQSITFTGNGANSVALPVRSSVAVVSAKLRGRGLYSAYDCGGDALLDRLTQTGDPDI